MWCVPMADDFVDTVAEDRIEDKELDGIEDSNPILGRTIIHWQPHCAVNENAINFIRTTATTVYECRGNNYNS
jgi:hypothetical protein